MTDPLRLAVVGLDERARNLFRMFFRGPCQNRATIVDHEKEADAFLIDLDTQQGSRLLATQREEHPERVFILLSVKERSTEAETIFVKKPAQAQVMIAAIEKAHSLVRSRKPKEESPRSAAAFPKAPPPAMYPARPHQPDRNLHASPKVAAPQPSASPADEAENRPGAMKIIARPDKEQTAVHKVAMMLDEQRFKSYLGHRDDIDPANPAQLATVFYDPKDFLQGHIQSAIKMACTRKEPMRLETPWKSITLLPEQNLAYLAADEAQIRAACGIPFRNIVGLDVDASSVKQLVNIRPVEQEVLEEMRDSPHLVRLDAFLWKIALYTSKGRLPKGLDINQAFFLKRWPGMTRLLLPPHAMRIAALLTQKPCLLFGASEKMGIRQQYVFAFVSAAHALGLIGQQTVAEEAKMPAEVDKPVATEQTERKSLFKKILSRLKLS